MKNILSVLLLSAFMMAGLAFASDCGQNNYPLLDVSKLENFKIELSEKQKDKIDKSVEQANKDIDKLVRKIDKTKTKIDKLNADTKKKKDEKLEQLQELTSQMTQYKVEIVRTTKEHKDKVIDILTEEQTNTLKTNLSKPEK